MTRDELRAWLDRKSPASWGYDGLSDPLRSPTWRDFTHEPCVCSSGFVMARVEGGWRMMPCSRCQASKVASSSTNGENSDHGR